MTSNMPIRIYGISLPKHHFVTAHRRSDKGLHGAPFPFPGNSKRCYKGCYNGKDKAQITGDDKISALELGIVPDPVFYLNRLL